MASYFELIVLLVLFLIPVLYETSNAFRYFFKFFVYFIVVSCSATILLPAMMFRPFEVRNLLWASFLCRSTSKLIGIKWEIRGKEHMEKDRACIIVANHQSALDVLGMFEIWPIMDKCTAVAKRELFYIWPFGIAAWLCGLIFIDRKRANDSRDVLSKATDKIKEKDIKLWVFPEGTRRNTGEIHSFKKGAFHMAIEGQVPIIPVVYSSYQTFLDDKKRILNPGEVIITTLPAVSTEGLTRDDIPRLMEDVNKMMNETFKKTSEEMQLRCKARQGSINVADASRIETAKNSEDIFDVTSKQKSLKDVAKAQ